jgi:hypothetical protein
MTDFGGKTSDGYSKGAPLPDKKLNAAAEAYANLTFRLQEGSAVLLCFADKKKNALTVDEQALGVRPP